MKKTEKSRFKSKYAVNTYISDAQYLAEFICERIAEKDGKRLPFKFWNTDKWKKVFIVQITHANKLLKEHSVKNIIQALKTRAGEKIYSLGAKAMILPLIKKIEKEKDTAFDYITYPLSKEVFVETEEVSKPLPAKRNLLKDLS